MTVETSLKWEDGIIARWESELKRRFPIGDWWARALSTVLVSSTLYNLKLYDLMGTVYPNVFITYIAPSGTGCKTPPLKFVKEFFIWYDKEILAPSRFTIEGFGERVKGTDGDSNRKPVKPHPYGVILRDEFSDWFNKKNLDQGLPEYLSEVYDGYLQGYYTRTYQSEGDEKVYYSFLGCSTEYFLQLMVEGFFIQGLGNRMLWVMEDPSPKEITADKFFDQMKLITSDPERDKLYNFTKEAFEKLKNVQVATMLDGDEVYVEYFNNVTKKTDELHKAGNSFDASYYVKRCETALKLAMIYAASRLSIFEGHLVISKEDMEMAIHDIEQGYMPMFKKVVEVWKQLRHKPKEVLAESSKYQLIEVLKLAERSGGIVWRSLVEKELGWSNPNQIINTLRHGVVIGDLEVAAEADQKGTLTDEEYTRAKGNSRGRTPQVFRITAQGREKLGLSE
ncbi:MAG: hypothetical protein QXX77_04575 [Candidatus Methanosuratincola sp.]